MDFRWNDWNRDHIAEHGITPEEVEEVVTLAKPPFPEYRGDGKHAVWGQTASGRCLQVIYIVDPHPLRYVIHARTLDEQEKRSLRRRRK